MCGGLRLMDWWLVGMVSGKEISGKEISGGLRRFALDG